MIQSVESSNRIEGVEVEPERLKPLVLGSAKPYSRPEEEILGYRRSLELIHKKNLDLDITPTTLAALHELAQEGAGDAGQWKRKNNKILEFDLQGQRRVRFVPVDATQTPHYIIQLCLAYQEEINRDRLPPLIICALFILDFLCIHPFRDGNGRVSRLLTLLLLYQQGIHVGRYISLERMIEENKADYYLALKQSSVGWHEKKHDPLPWINFFLSTVRQAYKQLAQKVEMNQDRSQGGKAELVEKIALNQIGSFALRDLQLQCPNISSQLIKKVLSDLKKRGLLVLVGRGRGARWKRG